jgi:hypothetical protein
MFDSSLTTRWFSGLSSAQHNITETGGKLFYNRPGYDWVTGNYQGGRTDGTATFNTNGYTGEYFQIQYAFL